MHSSKATDYAPGAAHKGVRAVARKLNAQVLTYFSRNEGELLQLLRRRLLALTNGRDSEVLVQRWHMARHYLDVHAPAFKLAFVAALEKSLNEEIQTIVRDSDRRGARTRLPGDPLEDVSLSLVGAEEMDRMLLRDQVVQRFNVHYEETLTPLTLRLRALFGRDTASLQNNPYRPEVLVRSLLLALKECSFDEDAAQAVLRAFDPQNCIDLGSLYKELDQLLAQSGISEQTHRLLKTSGADSGATGPAAVASVAATGWGGFASSAAMPWVGRPEYGRPVALHAREFLQKIAAGVPAGGYSSLPAVPGVVAVSGFSGATLGPVSALHPVDPYLLSHLEGLQAGAIESFAYNGLDLDLGSPNLLRQLREDEIVRHAQEFDRGTIDALAEVFDFVFSDPNIAPELKVVIGRLQIPTLKAALMDRNFFHSPNHPARKLIDALAGAAVAWTPEKGFDCPLYLQIEASVKRVLTEFDQDLALFSEVLLEFEEFQALAERWIKQQVEQLANVQEQEEALDAARAHVDGLIQARIAVLPNDRGRAAFLLPFLTDQWREVLARAYVNQAAEPDHWTLLLTTTDQLLWSVQRKKDSAERRQLVAVLPGLVRQLNLSLDALNWGAEERETFTRRLIATHMNAIRSTPDPAQEEGADLLDQRAGDEAVWMLDQRIAAAQVEAPDTIDAILHEFERGMWFDFLNDEDQVRRCRLTWVSPKRGRFLFTNREGFNAFVRSEREVADLMRQGRLKVLPREALVARAIHHIMAVPDASVTA